MVSSSKITSGRRSCSRLPSPDSLRRLLVRLALEEMSNVQATTGRSADLAHIDLAEAALHPARVASTEAENHRAT